MMDPQANLSLEDALRVKRAEVWLEVGQPAKALLELQELSAPSWESGWTVQVLQDAASELERAARLREFLSRLPESAPPASDPAPAALPSRAPHAELAAALRFRRPLFPRCMFRWAEQRVRPGANHRLTEE